jgi:hypothetical protein
LICNVSFLKKIKNEDGVVGSWTLPRVLHVFEVRVQIDWNIFKDEPRWRIKHILEQKRRL